MRPIILSKKNIPLNEISLEDLVAKLKQEIYDKGLTYQDIQKNTSLSRPGIITILNGKATNPTTNSLIEIAKAIGYELKFTLKPKEIVTKGKK